MRFPLRKRLPAAAALSLSSALLWGCLLGGTGTDTENGITDKDKSGKPVNITGVSARVVDGNGSPLKDVTLRLYPPGFRPDSGLAPASPLKEGAISLVSDSAGYVTIQLKDAGKFVVEGLSAGQTVFFDTLAVPAVTSSALFTFRTRTVRNLKGKVKLASGMRIDSGAVFVRGTAHTAKVDAAGGYDLGILPEDVGRMAVGLRFASSPTSVRQVTEVEPVPGVGQDPNKVTYVCNDVSKADAVRIASPTTFSAAAQDTGLSVQSKLDTSKVNSALQSCDSLTKGSVINVVSPAAGTGAKKDSVGVPLLVMQDATKVVSITGTRYTSAVVVPYAECVASTGSEKTSYDLRLQTMGSGSDILIQDVADKCLAK